MNAIEGARNDPGAFFVREPPAEGPGWTVNCVIFE